MFEPSDLPRVYGLAPGVDFPKALVDGLRARTKGQPPQTMAHIDLIVNTRRMARRLREIFDRGPAGFLPRIRLVTELDGLVPGITLPRAVSPLKRRLELAKLVSALLDKQSELAPRASLYALSDSLAALLDEVQGQGVGIEAITGLDVSDQSGHWDRAKRFLGIAETYLSRDDDLPDPEQRQRQLVTRIATHWADHPPENPVIIAGSTGSRGTTSVLMQAIARLPQGAVVLPGFDFDLPTAVWKELDKPLLSQDHPQYRFHDLVRALDLPRGAVGEWSSVDAPSPERNRLISLSLRPAPVTHAWLSEGPKLENLERATRDVTLVQAPSPRIEALTIAMRLRKAVEDGQSAALITPDRMLTRQVTSALDRWGIQPDDSAGIPLQLSPPGRFLRHVAGLFHDKLDAEALLTLLKHPLTHSGPDRNLHQLHTQRLEMRIRREGLPFPDPSGLAKVAQKAAKKMEDPAPFLAWVGWVSDTFCNRHAPEATSLADRVAAHLSLAETIAAGQEQDGDHELWKEDAGVEALRIMSELTAEAPNGGEMTATEYAGLLGQLLTAGNVRSATAAHPGVMIWGTLEARVQGADLVILGGLNDGTWPEAPAPDPWLNRQMRMTAGLLLPERRVGLSAHDYQQAVGAPEVWLTRATRSDEAETVPSRWLNRLNNLMNGLADAAGPESWEAMKTRGHWWLDQASALEHVERVEPAKRPSPRPPVAARPRRLSVTEIKRLIRDPYAIYAKHTLDLRPLNPLVQSPDAPLRGIVLHEVMERFVKNIAADPALLTRDHLLDVAASVLAKEVPWSAARTMWLARIARVADWFITREAERQRYSEPVVFEEDARGTHRFEDLGFDLVGYADRIDRTNAGDALIYDYKTGTPPSAKQQEHFDKQLLIEAAMVEQGGFREVGARPVAHAAFIGLGANPVEIPAPLDKEPPAKVLQDLHGLIAAYLEAKQGFTSRRMVETEGFGGDYDQLARFGEWDGTELPEPEDLT